MIRSAFLLPAFALLLAACGAGESAPAPDEGAPVVVGGYVEEMRFADRIEGVGTAYANESTILTSTVTERIEELHFNDGERVRAGEIIAELSRLEEGADLNSVQARVQEAEQQLQRLRELQDRGFATNASVDQQIAIRDAARADASAIRAQIGDRVIRAPFAGVVGLRRISPGTVVSAGTPIATVSDISSINLDFTLPERFISAVEPGQPIEAVAAAYPTEIFRGEIDGIDPVVDPVTRSITVRAVIPNPERKLRPGMLLTVDVVSNPREAPAVPATALVAQQDRHFVFRIDENGIARRTEVEIGQRQDGMVELAGNALALGEPIVADGTIKVRDDSPVSPNFPEGKDEARAAAETAKRDVRPS